MKKNTKTTGTTAILLALLMIATACTSSTDTKNKNTPQLPDGEYAYAYSLQQYDTCDTLETAIKNRLKEQVGPYGFNQNDYHKEEEQTENFDATTPEGNEPFQTTTVEEAYKSSTNVQEAGIDEPDVFKYNGETIAVISNEKLHTINPDTFEIEDTKKLPYNANYQIFLTSDKTYLIGTQYSDYITHNELDNKFTTEEPIPVEPNDGIGDGAEPLNEPLEKNLPPTTIPNEEEPELLKETILDHLTEEDTENLPTELLKEISDLPIDEQLAIIQEELAIIQEELLLQTEPETHYEYQPPKTAIVEYDLNNNKLNEQNVILQEGTHVSSRLTATELHVVTTHTPELNYNFVYPSSDNQKALAAAEKTNKEIINQLTLDEILPKTETNKQNDNQNCQNVHMPQELKTPNTLTVTSISSEQGIDKTNKTTLLADGHTVYATNNNMYITQTNWNNTTLQELNNPILNEIAGKEDLYEHTTIHKFKLGATPNYEASGIIAGTTLNQFSMDEKNDTLRIATTLNNKWPSESYIYTIQQNDNTLEITDHLGGLGKEEQIYSVRYINDTAYIVTFRETDPLYTIDLSDPENITKTGELKILGYSSYLHPLGNNHLIGVGQDADKNGRTKGLQISVFDVTDKKNPKRTQQHTLNNAYSNAEHDHKAFTYNPKNNLLILPIENYENDTPTEENDLFNFEEETKHTNHFNGITIFKVDENEITLIKNLPTNNNKNYNPTIRSAFVNETIIALTQNELIQWDNNYKQTKTITLR